MAQINTQNDPFLSKVSVEELRIGGFLDFDPPFDDSIRGGILPLFNYSQFDGLSQGDYQLIAPSLRLATTILGQPTLLPFWYALIFRERREIQSRRLTLRYGRHCWRFDLKPGGLTRQECVRTWQALQTMRQCVRFEFVTLQGSDGTTNRNGTRPGLQGYYGMGSKTELSLEYLKVLRDFAYRESGAEARSGYTPEFPGLNASAIIRARYHLAKTIVHEMGHVVKWATTSPQETRVLFDEPHPLEPPLEPFFGDQRRAEIGYAWESMTFKGLTFPFGYPSHPSAPFGLGVYKWPDLIDNDDPCRGPSRLPYNTRYAVPMAWAGSLWSQQHWDNVLQHGIEANWSSRRLGVRLYRQRPWNRTDELDECLSVEDEEDEDEDEDEDMDEDEDDLGGDDGPVDENRAAEFVLRERLHRIKTKRWTVIRDGQLTTLEINPADRDGDDSSVERVDINGVVRLHP